MIRSFSHRLVEELAEYATVPVINGLTDLSHPCQALSDVFTIFEKKGELKRIKLAYVGDGNNVCHSLLFASAKLGFDLSVASPKGYEPSVEVLRLVKGAKILNDPKEVVVGADVVYTDVWASMGQEAEAEKRALDFKDFQVNSDLLDLAKKDAMVMHCLPAHRGEEITDDVIDGPQSVVFDQAENRLHVQKAILALLIGA
jgi:ornithine carbamoyltransferase